ncbi:hypothetical protein BLS_009897 [Venturia inaequalis]|uniref:HlyIII-domain-containing protein n=1 Tax=Venturia inaequalis TaxID=5025 RepID=A0A8H3V0W1_VENIN|nr:hypothetical protein BLS_009897 [Venturia inaequalis]
MAPSIESFKMPHLATGISAPPLSLVTLDHGEEKDHHALIRYDELDEWRKDNDFVQTGYRKVSQGYVHSFQSIFKIHNETFNIWSHGIGCIAYLSLLPLLMIWAVDADFHAATTMDIVMLGIFFSAVAICFLCSTTFHVLENHSPLVWETVSQLDHIGIVLGVFGSTIPLAHFGFYCNHRIKIAYWILATVGSIGCGLAMTTPILRSPQGRHLRFALYSLFGLSTFMSAAHGVLINGWEKQNRMMGIDWFMGLAALNLVSMIIYALRIPERWIPLRFDVWGASHQAMHVMVIGGAMSHSKGLLRSLAYWQEMHASPMGACPANF